ncbi:hypothetical protein ACOYYM_14110 [Enterococcus durans]|uniref:hypothetical protein n=1 Tax=Enterococcus durans TaxID=53345 RepID=UPI003BC8786F
MAVTKIRVDQEKRIQKAKLPAFTDELWSAFDGLTSELTISFQRLNLATTEIKFLFLWLQTRTSFYLRNHFLDKAVKVHLK